MDSESGRKVSLESCFGKVDVMKTELSGNLDSQDSNLTMDGNSAVTRLVPFPQLCVLTIDLSFWWCPGGLLVGGPFCFHSEHLWLALHFPGRSIHPNYDYLIKSGGDTSKPLAQAVSLGRKPCHLPNLNKKLPFTTANPSSQPQKFISSNLFTSLQYSMWSFKALVITVKWSSSFSNGSQI